MHYGTIMAKIFSENSGPSQQAVRWRAKAPDILFYLEAFLKRKKYHQLCLNRSRSRVGEGKNILDHHPGGKSNEI